MNNKKNAPLRARSRHRIHAPASGVPALNATRKGTPMNRTIFRAAAGATALLVTASAGAAAVVIDTQQKAAAAALTTHNFFLGDNVSSTLPVMLIGLSYPSRDLAARTLGFLANATTPDALTASKGGMTLPCPLGGSFKAKLPRDGSLTLHLEWIGCTSCSIRPTRNRPPRTPARDGAIDGKHFRADERSRWYAWAASRRTSWPPPATGMNFQHGLDAHHEHPHGGFDSDDAAQPHVLVHR